MKFLLFLALAVGPALPTLAADSPAIDEADFTAASLPEGYKLKRPNEVSEALTANGHAEFAKTHKIYVVANDANSCFVTVTFQKLKLSGDEAKKQFLKDILHGGEAKLIKKGYKMTANDGVDWDKADLSKPYLASIVFENSSSGEKVFINERLTFADDAQVFTVVSAAAKSELQPLKDWADTIKLK